MAGDLPGEGEAAEAVTSRLVALTSAAAGGEAAQKLGKLRVLEALQLSAEELDGVCRKHMEAMDVEQMEARAPLPLPPSLRNDPLQMWPLLPHARGPPRLGSTLNIWPFKNMRPQNKTKQNRTSKGIPSTGMCFWMQNVQRPFDRVLDGRRVKD